MPETIAGYELFQLPCSVESSETHSFAEFRNPLGPDGFRSQILFGADTGLRRFSIPYDDNAPLPGGNHAATITVGGVTMNRAAYIRDLFHRSKVLGKPFVIQSPENGQYYLVEFEESEQSLTKKLAALYKTQVNLVQVRIPGVTVFDMLKTTGLWTWQESNEPGIDHSPAGHDFSRNGNSNGVGTVQNGLPTTRFNGGATNNGYWNITATGPVIFEAMFIMKMNEAVFSNFAGILTASSGVAAITGDQGLTTFYNQSLGATYYYRKNGVLYAANNQQAPMNAFGLVHWRSETGVGLTNPQIGKDRAATDRYAEMDLGEFILNTTLPPLSESLEKAEHLMTKWGI